MGGSTNSLPGNVGGCRLGETQPSIFISVASSTAQSNKSDKQQYLRFSQKCVHVEVVLTSQLCVTLPSPYTASFQALSVNAFR